PPILCLRFAVSLAVAAQDSRPSGSLLLSRKALSSSTSCRFSPAHCNRDVSTACPPPGLGIILGPTVGKDKPYESYEPSTSRDLDSGLYDVGAERAATNASPQAGCRAPPQDDGDGQTAHGGHGAQKGRDDAPPRYGQLSSYSANRTETAVSSRSGGANTAVSVRPLGILLSLTAVRSGAPRRPRKPKLLLCLSVADSHTWRAQQVRRSPHPQKTIRLTTSTVP